MTLIRYPLPDTELEVFVDLGPFDVDGVRYFRAVDETTGEEHCDSHLRRLVEAIDDGGDHPCGRDCDRMLSVDWRDVHCKETGLPADHAASTRFKWQPGDPVVDYGRPR